jgi:hypothetical protein
MRTLQTPGFKPFPAPQAFRPDGTALLSREVLSGVGHGNKKPPICGRFCFPKEPSDGLEPSTPSLPWRIRASATRPLNSGCYCAFPATRQVLSLVYPFLEEP